MNVGNENTGAATSNLELSLGFSRQCVSSSRSSDQGAGANAAVATSRMGMAYVASGPLSELVWSPHHGLSLKCAECSFIDKGKMVTSQASLVVTPISVRGTVPLAKPNFGHFAGKCGDVDEVSSIGKELAANANRKEGTSTDYGMGIIRKNDKNSREDFLSLKTANSLLHEVKDSSLPIPSSSSSERTKKNFIFATGNKKETNLDCSTSLLLLDRLECTAENELPLEKITYTMKTLLKGKAKVLSEVDLSKTTSKEKDNSSESVESCGSVGLLSGVKKRGRFEPEQQQLILGSKRVKNHIQDSTVSPSLVGQHSSFMNWISNIVNGLNRFDQDEDNKIVPYKENHHRQGANDMGFGTIFQSIYRPKEIGEPKELMATPVSCLADPACADVADGINYSEDNNKCVDPGSLWISRFSTKSREHSVNLDRPSLRVDDKSNEILSSYNLPTKNKWANRAITSVFAKRIDALNNIMPSEITVNTCFYCGKIDHDLRNCSEIGEYDRDNFIRNMSTYERMKVSRSCICIKCFLVGHWANSCPKEPTVKMESPSQLGTSNAVNSDDDMAKGENLASSGNSDDGVKLLGVPKGMFDAIRKIRLSRIDLHKWMNSRSSLCSLDGYFLRLRLGKWEKSHGSTGYYVACITGERKGKQPQGSKRPITVDIEGKSCLVESRYISNQDFVEEELTAWWFTAVKSGGSIPSGNDMQVKYEERQRLGF